MKKYLSVLLTICFIVALTTGVAEENVISFRNGINFGDNLETVKEKEDVEIFIHDDWYLSPWQGNDIKFFGMKGSNVYYFFDDEGLCEVGYNINGVEQDQNVFLGSFDSLTDALSTKYGAPLENKHGITSVLTGYAFGLFMNYALPDADHLWIDYKEWIVEQDGYKVKIDLIGGGHKYMGMGLGLSIFLSYKKVNEGSSETTDTILGVSEFDRYQNETYDPMNDI